MKKLRQMFIAIEEQIQLICPRPQLYEGWCKGCKTRVEMITFADAANIACTDIDGIIERTANGKVHLGIRPEALLVCLNSLVRSNHAPIQTVLTGKEKAARRLTI